MIADVCALESPKLTKKEKTTKRFFKDMLLKKKKKKNEKLHTHTHTHTNREK